jgi:hypothetical protein
MSAVWFDEWANEQESLGEHAWLEMKGVFRDPEPYPDDDWESGYVDWDWSIRQGELFPDLTEDDEAARWLAEHDPDR